ncbi:MAG: 23S rRNA (pseudouridine(1915)-N(3))-methyltransferase RlmH [Clostridiales bacterium]|nr:23S rRNA (pseudouridine(1915)-N(3))-methyltransferase RlmH [Clostridiales bacterium]
MLKINLVVMGDIKEKFFTEAINEYSKRISRFANLNIIELKENIASGKSSKDIENALKKDAELIKKHLKGYIVVLDVLGKTKKSEDFAKSLNDLSLTNSEISFVIGASNGLHEEIKSTANEKLSFSPMTFPHQLMRVIFLEQLYRAFTIINNISYHK